MMLSMEKVVKNGKVETLLLKALMLIARKMAEVVLTGGLTEATTKAKCKIQSSMDVEKSMSLTKKRPTKASSTWVNSKVRANSKPEMVPFTTATSLKA